MPTFWDSLSACLYDLAEESPRTTWCLYNYVMSQHYRAALRYMYVYIICMGRWHSIFVKRKCRCFFYNNFISLPYSFFPILFMFYIC